MRTELRTWVREGINNPRTLLKNSRTLLRTVGYILAQVLQRTANILLLPLLVTRMDATEFSRYGLLSSVYLLLGALFTLQIHLAPQRLYFDYEDSQEQADLLFSTLFTSLALNIGFSLIVLIILRVFHIADAITLGKLNLQILVVLTIVTFKVMEFGIMLMRIQGKAFWFMFTAGVRQFSLLGLFFLLSGYFLHDVLLAFIVAFVLSIVLAAAMSIGFSYSLFKKGRFKLSILKGAVVFALPLAIHTIASWFIQNSGRWIGTAFISLEALAPYNLVIQIFLVFSMFIRAMFEAQLPDIGSAFGKNEIKRGLRIVNWTTLVGIGIVILLYGALFIGLYALPIKMPLSYVPNPMLIVMAMLGNIFDAIYLRGIQINQALKATHTQAFSTIVAGLLTIGLSFILVQYFADIGLIWGFAIGMALQAGISNMLANRELVKELANRV